MVYLARPKGNKRYDLMKKHIRDTIVEKRKKLAKEYIHEYSMELSKKFFDSEIYKNAQIIMSYVSIKGEFETKYINRRILSEGKILVLPKTYGQGIMKAFEVKNMDELVKNCFGLHEPLEGKEHLPDLIIVPGVAFDKKGNRIGFGGGYYDRYLQNKNVKTVALCYEFQIVEGFVVEEHDIPVDYLLYL